LMARSFTRRISFLGMLNLLMTGVRRGLA
jgi:hypothetical protein